VLVEGSTSSNFAPFGACSLQYFTISTLPLLSQNSTVIGLEEHSYRYGHGERAINTFV
jgi:hypothetical protein